MPPLPPAAKCLKVSFIHTVSLDSAVTCITHWKYSGGPPSAADCVSIAGAFNAQWVSNLKPLVNTNWHLDKVLVLDIDSTTGAEGANLTVSNGSRAGSFLPGSTAMVLSHQIARRYRGGHPRNYWPFGNQGDLANAQQWVGTFTTACQSAWAALVAGAVTITAGTTDITNFVNVSYHSGRALRPTPVVDNVLATAARVQVGSQRRRNV